MDVFEFRKQMALLPEPVTDLKPPFWEFWRQQIWNLALTQDPSRFFDWPCVYHCFLHNHWPNCIAVEHSYLMRHRPDWAMACSWPGLGGTPDYHEGTKLSRSLIHQAYHLLKWEHTSGCSLKDLESIVEIGGGYGAMALICRRLGFQGRYDIVDVPEFSLLQRYYLSQVAPNWGYGFWTPDSLDSLIDCSPFSLFLGMYSLSEIPYDERHRYLAYCQASSYLFLYSKRWQDYDNVKYFTEWAQEHRPDMAWQHWCIDHMPPESWYTMGW